MTKYLHTMIRVSSLEDTIAFFEVLGLREIRRRPDDKGRYTNVFLAAPGDEAAAVAAMRRHLREVFHRAEGIIARQQAAVAKLPSQPRRIRRRAAAESTP